MKNYTLILFIFQVLVWNGCKTKELTAEQLVKANEYALKIEKPDFEFVPNNAQALRGHSFNLTPNYYLKVSNDTIKAYLPYFGRSYIAPIDPMNIGVSFTSTDFEYSSVKKKNGVYEIKIKPNDVERFDLSGILLFLDLSASEYGNLRITFVNKESISYYGTIN